MSDLAEFLRARIAEDEAAALEWERVYNDAGPVPGSHGETMRRHRQEWPSLWRSLDRFPPERVLREVEAKRGVVELYDAFQNRRGMEDRWENGQMEAAWEMLKMISRAYSDHPDFRDEWRV